MTSTTSLWAGLLVLGASADTWAAESAERVATTGTGLQGLDLLSMAGVGILALLVLLRRRPPH